MEPEAAKFHLRCQLHGHEEDVRGIGICGEYGFATGSRDKTVRLWAAQEVEEDGYRLEKTLVGHTSFVGPVAWIPPNDKLPKGGLVSGGMDTLVIIWNAEDSNIVQTLRGHDLQVTSVVVDEQGDILSASIDRTVRRWKNGQTVEVLRGHKGPVQAVLNLPSGQVVTGSSDCTLKVWRGSKCLQTFSGHTDTVRGLALMPNVGILSASHDGSVRLWATNGELLLEMVGHTAIVYCVAAHVSGDIASGSEDCFVKIWRNGLCYQSIQHPGCVWDIKFLPNGDLITACSDGIVRIWTRNSRCFASPDEIKAYEAQVAAWKSHTKMVGGVKITDLPGIEALKQPGTKDGQTKIVREGDSGVAYSWNVKEFQWDKVGEVVDTPGNVGDKRTLNGLQYDYVFDVDIGDGEPTRKLPYNRGDNPYAVADHWLLSESLPLSYRQQVVDFILQSTGQNTPVIDSTFSDPYTGANAYVPQQQNSWTSGLSVPSSSNKAKDFTLKHIPKKGMLLFDAAQYDGIIKKLESFNSSLETEEKRELALSDVELSRLRAVMSTLKDVSDYTTSSITDDDILPLKKLLALWPASMLFPGLDMLRIILLHPQGASLFAQYADAGQDVLMQSLHRAAGSTLDANQLMGIRISVNCFRHVVLRKWIAYNRSEILDMFSECHLSSNKNVRLAYSTLLLNYCVLLIETKDEAGQIQVLSAALEMAGPQENDVVSRYRALLTLGSLMLDGLVKNVAVDLDIKSIAQAAATSNQSQILEVGKDIEHVLSLSGDATLHIG